MDADIAGVAALFADPTRATLLSTLMSGQAHTPTELAKSCGVAPATMSGHLDVLLSAGAVSCLAQGRHRYYTLADPQLAVVFESLAVAADVKPVNTLRGSMRQQALRAARSCYDHLAGVAGVQLLDGLLAARLLTPASDGYDLTDLGTLAFAEQGISVRDPGRRRFAYGCLDWTERRCHLAGALGAAILTHALTEQWLRRRPDHRALTVMPGWTDAVARLCRSPL